MIETVVDMIVAVVETIVAVVDTIVAKDEKRSNWVVETSFVITVNLDR